MEKLPTKEEVRDMKFSSLACRVHDWIHSSMRSVISGPQKQECAKVIDRLVLKLQGQEADPSRTRIVQRLKKDLDSLLTYAQATQHKKEICAVRIASRRN